MAEPRGPYWDARLETLPRDELAHVQFAWLQWQVRRCYEGSAFWRERLDAAGLPPGAPAESRDFRRLPPLGAEDLRREQAAHPPFGRGVVAPQSGWREAFPAGPPSAAPLWGVWSEADLHNRRRQAARLLWQAGVRPDDVLNIRLSRASPAATLALADAAERIGCLTVATGDSAAVGATGQALARRVVQVVTPPEPGRDAADLAADAEDGSRGALVLAFQHRLRLSAAERAGLPLLRLYGPQDYALPVAGECEARAGLHVIEDDFLLEALDPASGAPLPLGQAGALALTTLSREATPLLRLLTADRGALTDAPCSCGRTTLRLLPAD